MTVNTTDIVSGPYEGNDVTDTFDYGFTVKTKLQLSVYETDDLGVETLLVVDVGYTVNDVGTEGGGDVLRIAGALPTDYEWLIRSNYQPTQLTDFDSQGGFFSDNHENAFDKLTFLIQQMLDTESRTLRVSDTYTGDLPLTMEDPDAGLALRWNGDADGLENYTPAAAGDLNTVDIDQGIMLHDPTVDYLEGSLVRSLTNKAIMRAIQANTNQDPDVAPYDGIYWGHTDPGILSTLWGPTQADLEDALAESLARKTWLDCAGTTYEITSDFIMPQGSRMKNFRLKFINNVAFRGDKGCAIKDFFIDGNSVADYGIREVIGLGSGFARSLIDNGIILGCLINDINLGSDHWMLDMRRVQCWSQGLSGYGMHIDNFSTTQQPDIRLSNCYVDSNLTGVGGMNLEDGSFHLSSCSADNQPIPFNLVNANVVMDSCGFEQFSSSAFMSASQLKMNMCTMITKDITFVDDSGQRAMITLAGGTQPGSLEIDAGSFINGSVDKVYIARGNSITVPAFMKIGSNVKRSLTGSGTAIGDYIYQSLGAPAINVARLSYLGESRTAHTWGSQDPTGATVFPIEIAPNSECLITPASGTMRYLEWHESGTNTAGAPTTVDLQILNQDNTIRKTIASVIAVAGAGSGTAQRFGSYILDELIAQTERVKFVVSTAGQRQGSGFDITLVIDQGNT